jgi:hypothetical protein
MFRLGAQGVGMFLLLGVFLAKCGSSLSARFLIYRAHAVYFFPLVATLNPPHFRYNLHAFAI